MDGDTQINTWMNVTIQKSQCTMKPCCYPKTLFKTRSQEKVFRYLDRDPRRSVLPKAPKETSLKAIFIQIMTFLPKKMLKSTSDNQSIPFPKETEWQHQNNNMITIRITICLNGERQNSFVMLRILPRMIFKYTL